ncbi:MAG: succinate dehydrogenase, cytochrome b556 subunit [Anaerolineaceae bacterium]|nr:succinate dehydrogenase, cytochrome b556 subunit [Anaerolineaceae bacterium]
MASLVLTVSETLRYRGAIGQWSWVLHRLSGLGVVLFVTLHIIDTSWAFLYPDKYVEAIATYQTPLFTIGEFILVACVIYHALNGFRIIAIDFRPAWWKYQERAALLVLAGTVVILVPVFIGMFGHVINFYGSGEPVLPLVEVLQAQIPFVVGIVAAIVVGVLFSFLQGLIAGGSEKKTGRAGSAIERFWWSYMRISGLLIIPLVFGHLAMMHVIQGVFDITAANSVVVGTDAINQTGTAVEFVANRWNLLVGGVAVWKLYDFGLLALVVIHGFNGLRYVLTDYTAKNPMLRRGMMYVTLIGAVILIVVGTLALIGTIDSSAIEMAQRAAESLHQ